MRSAVAELIRTSNPLILAQLRHSLTPAPFTPSADGSPQPVTDPPLLAGVAVALDALETIASAFDGAVNRAADDANLSAQGKADAASRAERVTIANLEGFETVTGAVVLSRRIATLEQSVVPRPSAARSVGDVIVAELRAREIRDQVRGLDPMKWELLHRGTKDAETRRALEDGPLTMFRARPDGDATMVPFVPDAARADAAEIALEAANPAVASELRDLRSIQRTYASQVSTIKTGMREVVGAH